MNELCIDAAYKSLNKYGEELCGDRVQILKADDKSIVVLADGLGSGVKANILSTLTSKIILTMIEADMSLEECVSTIISTLPVCKERGVAYSTFSIIKITNNDYAEIIQYDNPKVILLRDGKSFEYETTAKEILGKQILESRVKLKQDDVFVVMSDGAIYAGVGKTLNYGWQREQIVEYLENNYNYKLSAKGIATLVADACNALYEDKPGDDTTIATVQLRKRKTVNLLFGPPRDPADCDKMMMMFFGKSGKHIVSGGTTSTIAAKYLGKEIKTSLEYFDDKIPPTAEIEGVDLVTEGVLTISKVLEYAEDYLMENSMHQDWHVKKDGASRLARLLLEEATDINFFVGRAINPAHQNPELPIGFNIKMQLAESLAKDLEKMGKNINVSYF